MGVVVDTTSSQLATEMGRARIGEEKVNSSLYKGGDLYVRLKNLRKHLEFLDLQKDYIKVKERGGY